MNYQQINYEVKDKVGFITLNRPKKMNAFTPTMFKELVDAFKKADDDDGLRALIVSGEGEAFCAGDDISVGFDFAKELDDTKKHRDIGGVLALTIYDMKKPVIGAINGAAVGIGSTMTLPMDVRLASKNAKMGFVFSRRGIVLEACSSWFLPRIVGITCASELAITGRVFTANEALNYGLVSKVLDGKEQLMTEAIKIAREIADFTSPISVALCRQLLWRNLGVAHPMEAHKIESKCLQHAGTAPDIQEGVNSFLEKRPPAFKSSPSNDMPSFYPWWEEQEF
jgi:enoyl-CoA hydratase/carnithine racemase